MAFIMDPIHRINKERREKEIRKFLDWAETELAKKGAAHLLKGWSEKKDAMISYWDQMYVNNPPGDYEIIATYSSQKPDHWNGKLQSKPLRISIMKSGNFFDVFHMEKSKP